MRNRGLLLFVIDVFTGMVDIKEYNNTLLLYIVLLYCYLIDREVDAVATCAPCLCRSK